MRREEDSAGAPKVDVAIQALGKPWQTALCLASLWRYMGPKLGKIFFVPERSSIKHDGIRTDILAGLIPRMVTMEAEQWLELSELETSKIKDPAYRRSLRYQLAWEESDAPFLLVLHNDVHFRGDILPCLFKAIEGHVGAGGIGQCWNCPASDPELCARLGINGGKPCSASHYADFKISFSDLHALYTLAKARGKTLRLNPLAGLAREFQKHPWPLPECRLNEWCCLVDMTRAKPATLPLGRARPFGAYIAHLDLGVGWFRDMHMQGHTFGHCEFPQGAMIHYGGHRAMFYRDMYFCDEEKARGILARDYPGILAELEKRGLPPPGEARNS